MTPGDYCSDVRRAAVNYIARGYAIVSLPFASKKPDTKNWGTANRVTSENVEVVFNGTRRNVGMLLGRLTDVDLDCPEAIRAASEVLPPTGLRHGRPTNPNSHYWYDCLGAPYQKFSDPTDGKTLLELRGADDGQQRQTVLPPSRHPTDAEQYEWVEFGDPGVVTVESLHKSAKELAAIALLARHWPDRGRRHDAALAFSRVLLDRGVDPERARKLVRLVATAALDEEADDRVRTVDDTVAVLRAGGAATGFARLAKLTNKVVIGKALEWLDLPAGRISAASAHSAARGIVNGQYTQIELANRLAAKHGKDLRYCGPLGGWHVYDRARFGRDAQGRAVELAKDAAADLWDLIRQLPDDQRPQAIRFARMAGSARGIDDTLKLSRSIPGIAAAPEDFDRDPYHLNVLNGTLDLRTRVLRPHDRRDLITKLAPVDFVPDAPCPLWEATLDLVFGRDPVMSEFFQRAVGYSLTGSVSEQVMFVAYGGGENGKTTLLEAIHSIVGGYGYQANPELLLESRAGTQHPTGVASLRGCRFVTSVETGEGRNLAESLVKHMTGGEKITARRMHQDFFTFAPTHKLWVATNHRPVIRGTDHGIWRRLVLIPFEVKISAVTEPDKHFAEKLRGEAQGILSWAVRGAFEWHRRGLDTPRRVKAATAEYRADSDVVGQYIAERCVVGRGHSVAKGELFDDFAKWCAANGETKFSKKRLGQRMLEQGCGEHNTGSQRRWLGIGLIETARC